MVRYLWLGLCLLVVACATTSCTRSAGTEPSALAQHVMGLLHGGNYAAVADLLYEPPSYGHAQLAQERQALTKVLAYLGGAFGPPTGWQAADVGIVFYKLSIAGADNPYWKSLPSFGIDHALVYRVPFGQVGPGILAFTFIRAKGGWEVRSIEFGLALDAPQARETMVRIGRGFLRQASRFDEATISRLLDEMFPQVPATTSTAKPT
jgi:hypothetical protein